MSSWRSSRRGARRRVEIRPVWSRPADEFRAVLPTRRLRTGLLRTRPLSQLAGIAGVAGDTEEIRSVASALRHQYRGVLAVTSARLLFIFQRNGEKELFEKPLSGISVAQKGLRTKRLIVSHDGETTEFNAIEPRGRIQEINAALPESART